MNTQARKKEFDNLRKSWTEQAHARLVGLRIAEVRYLTKGEMDALGWTQSVLVIELENGTLLFPSMDDEGNDGGALFGQTKQGEDVTFPVIRPYF